MNSRKVDYISLGTLGYTPEEQYELTYESVSNIKNLAGKDKILIGTLGHGAQSEFRKYRRVLDDLRLNYYYCSLEQMDKEKGKPFREVINGIEDRTIILPKPKKNQVTNEYFIKKYKVPIILPKPEKSELTNEYFIKNYNVKEIPTDCDYFFVFDDWVGEGRTLMGGILWGLDNHEELGIRKVYSAVLLDKVGIAHYPVVTTKIKYKGPEDYLEKVSPKTYVELNETKLLNYLGDYLVREVSNVADVFEVPKVPRPKNRNSLKIKVKPHEIRGVLQQYK